MTIYNPHLLPRQALVETFVARQPRGAGAFAPDRMQYFGELALQDLEHLAALAFSEVFADAEDRAHAVPVGRRASPGVLPMFSRKKQPPIKSLIAQGSRIDGNITFAEGLRVDGDVVGDIRVDESQPSLLVISETATVMGAVYADHLIINGRIKPGYAALKASGLGVSLAG